jgi:hypothetical protein
MYIKFLLRFTVAFFIFVSCYITSSRVFAVSQGRPRICQERRDGVDYIYGEGPGRTVCREYFETPANCKIAWSQKGQFGAHCGFLYRVPYPNKCVCFNLFETEWKEYYGD